MECQKLETGEDGWLDGMRQIADPRARPAQPEAGDVKDKQQVMSVWTADIIEFHQRKNTTISIILAQLSSQS